MRRVATACLLGMLLTATGCELFKDPMGPDLDRCKQPGRYEVTFHSGVVSPREAAAFLARKHGFQVLADYSSEAAFVADMSGKTAFDVSGEAIVAAVRAYANCNVPDPASRSQESLGGGF
jgi:hypothetical protein